MIKGPVPPGDPGRGDRTLDALKRESWHLLAVRKRSEPFATAERRPEPASYLCLALVELPPEPPPRRLVTSIHGAGRPSAFVGRGPLRGAVQRNARHGRREPRHGQRPAQTSSSRRTPAIPLLAFDRSGGTAPPRGGVCRRRTGAAELRLVGSLAGPHGVLADRRGAGHQGSPEVRRSHGRTPGGPLRGL